MAEYTSGIKEIRAPRRLVYETLSDLRGLGRIQEALKDHPEAGRIEIRTIDQDSCAFVIPMAGELMLRIVDREPEKTIKLKAENSPIPLTLWIQLLEPNEGDTRLRLTLRAELNFLMKNMLGDKLEEGTDKLASMMAMIPYHQS